MKTLRNILKSVVSFFNYNKPKTIVLNRRDNQLDKDNLARIYIKID